METGFHPSTQFNIEAMAWLMRQPEIYWSGTDALAPQPEQMAFEQFLLDPNVLTVAALWNNTICGFVYVVKRTSILGELHCGFHPSVRGRLAKGFVEYTIEQAWQQGFLKLWTLIPVDNRAAILGAKACGFTPEGRIKDAIMRQPTPQGKKFPERFDNKPGPKDVMILTLARPEWRQ